MFNQANSILSAFSLFFLKMYGHKGKSWNVSCLSKNKTSKLEYGPNFLFGYVKSFNR